MAEHHEDADIELAGPRLRLLACAQENDVAGVARILQQHPELRDARSDKGVTAVHEAAQRGSLAVLALLRDCGARLNIPNVEWMTPLMVALLHGQGAAVSLLLEACPAAVAGRNGAAVLGLCVQLGLPEPFLRQLHAAGAQPDAVGRWGGTPLHMAAERGSAAAVRQLLKLKERVDVDVPDCEGWTPLHLAAGLADKRACSAIVATLLHAGANPEARTANGHRPLDVSRAGDTAAVALLERKTAAQPASAILSPVAGTAAEAAEQPAGAVPLALVSSPQLGPPTPAKVGRGIDGLLCLSPMCCAVQCDEHSDCAQSWRACCPCSPAVDGIGCCCCCASKAAASATACCSCCGGCATAAAATTAAISMSSCCCCCTPAAAASGAGSSCPASCRASPSRPCRPDALLLAFCSSSCSHSKRLGLWASGSSNQVVACGIRQKFEEKKTSTRPYPNGHLSALQYLPANRSTCLRALLAQGASHLALAQLLQTGSLASSMAQLTRILQQNV